MFRRRKKGRTREDEVAILVAGPSSSGEAATNANKNKRRYKMFGGKKGQDNSASSTSSTVDRKPNRSTSSTDARKPNRSSSASALVLEQTPMQLETKSVNASSSSAQLPPANHSTSTDRVNSKNATPLTSSAGTAGSREGSGGGRGQKSAFNAQQPPSDTSNADRLSGRTPSQPIGNVGFDGSAEGNGRSLPLQRTGWSNVSAASSAANSEQYIQKLDNLPATSTISSSGRTTKVRSLKSPCIGPTIRWYSHSYLTLCTTPPIPNAQSDERIKAAISRPFGRNNRSHQKWFVKIRKPFFDEVDSRFKYKISIEPNPALAYGRCTNQQLFTSSSAKRSLQDFLWLEQALRAEYHGALLVPFLSLALYFNALSEAAAITDDDSSLNTKSVTTSSTSRQGVDSVLEKVVAGVDGTSGSSLAQSFRYLEAKMDQREAVSETVLAEWLSDIINGIRGNGEVIISNRVDVVESEAMETFLYRHSETLGGKTLGFDPCRASGLGSLNIFSLIGLSDSKVRCDSKSFGPILDCFGSEAACVDATKRSNATPLAMCTPESTGASIQQCNSILSESGDIDFAWLQQSSRGSASHSKLIDAEKDLIVSYLKSTSLALDKVTSLSRDEAYIGLCWRRFAVSLAELFSVEKDLEQAHIGDSIKSSKKRQPFRKLRKSAVEESLRLLANAKVSRAAGLVHLKLMLNAYYADFASVVPALKEYAESAEQLNHIETNSVNDDSTRNGGSNEWQSLVKELTLGVTRHITGGSVSIASDPTADEESHTLGSLSTIQTRALHKRLKTDEQLLLDSITLLCKASALRNARMAYQYLKTELQQASEVHSNAKSLRTTLSIDADTAIAMKERRYDDEERQDNVHEMEIVLRILDLSSAKTEDDGSREDDYERNKKRQNAIQIVKENPGRWNQATALAIMSAAGIDDAKVQIDETSRELRHVRKYAISLREHVSNCLEAADVLNSAYAVNSESEVQIGRSRREFWAASSAVFSGKIVSIETLNMPNTPSAKILTSVGVDIGDRGGWLGQNGSDKSVSLSSDRHFSATAYAHHHILFNNSQNRRRCGETARQYLKKRDNQTHILTSRIVKLLEDYERRLDGIESFVYMHCVGIQLEKHCSRARTKALSGKSFYALNDSLH